MPYGRRPRRFSFRRRRFGRRNYVRSRRTTRSRRVTKRTVSRMISRRTENKKKQSYRYTNVLRTPIDGATFLNQNLFRLGPENTNMIIDQGTGQGQRIGNRVRTKKLVIRGTVLPRPYDQFFNNPSMPVQVKVWFFYEKTTPVSLPAPLTNFFQDGNTAKGFQNNVVDLWSPVNKDRYRVLGVRSFKIGTADYAGGGSDIGVTIANQYFSNNDFKMNANFRVDLTRMYPKIVKWDDQASQIPTSRGLFMLWTYAFANGGAAPASHQAVEIKFMQDYVYEDA